jgi:hypothetical protein
VNCRLFERPHFNCCKAHPADESDPSALHISGADA